MHMPQGAKVLLSVQTYALILVDVHNTSPWFIKGERAQTWNDCEGLPWQEMRHITTCCLMWHGCKGGKLAPVRPDPLLLDAPLLAVHWPKLLLWAPFQASIFYDFIKQIISELPDSLPGVFWAHHQCPPRLTVIAPALTQACGCADPMHVVTCLPGRVKLEHGCELPLDTRVIDW
jgi:hypothetical protein